MLVHFQEDHEVNKTDEAVEKVNARKLFYSLFFCLKKKKKIEFSENRRENLSC